MRWAAGGRAATRAGAWTVVAAALALAPAAPALAERAPAPGAAGLPGADSGPHADAPGSADRTVSAGRQGRSGHPGGPGASPQPQGAGTSNGSGHANDPSQSHRSGRPDQPGSSDPSSPSGTSPHAGRTDAPAHPPGSVLPHVTLPPMPLPPFAVVRPPAGRPGGLPHLPLMPPSYPGPGRSAPQAAGGGTAGADQPQATGPVPSDRPPGEHGQTQDGGRATGKAGPSTPAAGAGRKPARPGPVVRPYAPPRPLREPSFVPVPGAPAGTTAPTSDAPVSEPTADEQADPIYEPARRVLRVLPLGAGLALVGLGIGFLGWRLRRA